MNTKLGILAHNDKVQLQDKGNDFEIVVLKLCPSLSKNF